MWATSPYRGAERRVRPAAGLNTARAAPLGAALAQDWRLKKRMAQYVAKYEPQPCACLNRVSGPPHWPAHRLHGITGSS